MSKKITILEGNETRTFTGVNKIQTNKVGGGTVNWVPEDEAAKYVSMGELSVYENGDYSASSDGYAGYSSVHVEVSGGGGGGGGGGSTLTTKTITENGTYNASEDGADGYSSVTVNVTATEIDGVDPDTGENTSYTIDPSTGEVKKTVIPKAIGVTQYPTKTEYKVGETIDYTGIIARLYKAEGVLFTDSTYPTSEIPFNELIFPVKTAPEPES